MPYDERPNSVARDSTFPGWLEVHNARERQLASADSLLIVGLGSEEKLLSPLSLSKQRTHLENV